ncbi:MAG TPA: hypothetical protein PKC21_01435 [Oligoflexia bacterium]|nr:hypothetical protein [Oligoflexia bacterium]HMR23993.1 hypothetical protein [Oligoflexia bacterium]
MIKMLTGFILSGSKITLKIFLFTCIFHLSACLQQPKLKEVPADHPSLPPLQTFDSDQTNLEMISYDALKAKVKRVFNLNDGSNTITILENLESEFKSTTQFSSGIFRSLLTVFDEACTEADLLAIGLANSSQPGVFWKALTGLDITQEQLDSVATMLADPGLLNSVQRREMVCLNLALQATVWLKR